MIVLRNKCSKDFMLDGFFHSRHPDKVLTKKVEDLNITVSSYTCKNVKGDMNYIDIWLNEDPSKFFWMGDLDSLGDKNDTGWHGWSIHFKTWDNVFEKMKPGENHVVLDESQKRRLFEAVSRIIPKGDTLSTYGTITKGGVHAMERFKDLGFKRVGTAYPKDYDDRKTPIAVPIWEKI